MQLNVMEADLSGSARSRMGLGLLLSLILHLGVLLLLQLDQPVELPEAIEVTFLPPPAPTQAAPRKPPEQIVSPSEAPEKTPPKQTTLRSDRDTAIERETIARGMPEAAKAPTAAVKPTPPVENTKPAQAKETPRVEPSTAKTPPKPSPERKPKAEAEPKTGPETKTPTDSEPSLRLSGTELARAIGTLPVQRKQTGKVSSEDRLRDSARGIETKPQQSDGERAASLQRYTPFRPSSAGALFSRRGTPDHLPTVQDGEVTLLNAKADRHAVFVRRVALQVFGALRQLSWSEVPFERIRGANDFVTVYATMSNTGKLLKVELRDSSGSVSFDQVAVQAAERGTWDQNPPETAQTADGTIRFVFKAKSWSRRIGEMNQEQRWLLLSTGLL